METKEKNGFFNFKPFDKQNLLKLVCYVSVVLFAISIIVSIILACCTNISATLVGDYFMSDWAETMSYCLIKNPYDGFGIHSIYPPFAYLPFYLFALICKKPLTQYMGGEIPLQTMYKQPTFVISYVLFFAIMMALILLVVAKMSKMKGKSLAYLLITVFCYGPFLYTFGRGNNIISVALLVLLFFWLYKSDKWWARELGNLSLAAAVAIKIYPAILLLFFLKDHKWLDLLKTLAYSLILIFIPFLFIQGGFGNIKLIWKNFTSFNSGQGRDQNFSNISLDGTCSKFVSLLSMIFGGANLSVLYSILSKITRYGLLLIAVILPIFAKKSKLVMQSMLLTILTYELFQGVSYGYTMDMLIAPIVLYFVNFEDLSKVNKWYYGICFALLACSPFYIAKFFLVQALVLIALVVKAIIDLIKDVIRIFKENKALKSNGNGDKKEEPEKQETNEVEKTKTPSTKRAKKKEVTPLFLFVYLNLSNNKIGI